jgi:hypothetical protein
VNTIVGSQGTLIKINRAIGSLVTGPSTITGEGSHSVNTGPVNTIVCSQVTFIFVVVASSPNKRSFTAITLGRDSTVKADPIVETPARILQ